MKGLLTVGDRVCEGVALNAALLCEGLAVGGAASTTLSGGDVMAQGFLLCGERSKTDCAWTEDS
jgi:hypothetical protein